MDAVLNPKECLVTDENQLDASLWGFVRKLEEDGGNTLKLEPKAGWISLKLSIN